MVLLEVVKKILKIFEDLLLEILTSWNDQRKRAHLEAP